jgi:hypothetical protein
MSIKRIEMEWEAGMVLDIFKKACKLALQHQCDQVIFPFNGGIFSVSRSSFWNEEVATKLQTFPRVEQEIEL